MSVLNKCKIIVWFPEEDRESTMPPQSGDRPLPPPPSREPQEYQEYHHRQAPQSQETSAVETPTDVESVTPADVFHPKDPRPQPEVFHPMDPPPLPQEALHPVGPAQLPADFDLDTLDGLEGRDSPPDPPPGLPQPQSMTASQGVFLEQAV